MNKQDIIGIASDHAGFELKSFIIQNINKKFLLNDYGTKSTNSVDYPDFAHIIGKKITAKEISKGILICGSAIGVSITANRYLSIRAAVCWKKEIAELSRKHNDANVICLPARFIEKQDALEMIHIFLTTSFEGERHLKRIQKINPSL